MEMTTMKDIRKALEVAKYKVHTIPQEKTLKNELVLILSDIGLEVESQTSYIAKPQAWIGWCSEDPDEIITTACAIVTALTAGVREASFVFGKPQIEILGTLYRVSITCEWKSVVTAVPPALT
jgi:hypothetical protein